MQAFVMTRCRPLTAALLVGGLFTIFDANWPLLAAAANSHTPNARATIQSPATEAARRYADAISKGDRGTFGLLDFACQYRLVTASPPGRKAAPEASDPSYEACWKELTAGHTSSLKRTDIGMDVLWPSAGPLVFYGDELSNTPASAFVMDAIGTSPPGSGLRLIVTNSRRIPDGSFRLKPNGKIIGVPTTLVAITVAYQD